MMKSSAKYFAVSYLIFFVVLSGLVSACQGKTSVTLGSTWDPQGFPPEEVDAAIFVQHYIQWYASSVGYETQKLYKYGTTKANILEAAGGVAGWVSPTGYSDPDGGWSYETNAYDDNEDTYAQTEILIQDAWSKFLYLTLPSAITCDKIRALNKYVPYYCYYDIDVYRGGSWVDVFDGYLTGGWDEFSFTEGSVTQLRVRVKRVGGTAAYILRLYEADFGIASYASGFGDSYLITWYIGHGDKKSWPCWVWPYHYHTHMCIVAEDGTWVYDYEIYPETSSRKTRFVFLWSCLVGEEIGYMQTYQCGETRAYGMPFAWLHTTDLSSDGYTAPDGGGYVFIGFRYLAPFLTDDYVENVTDGCKYFVTYFYGGALVLGLSIKDALNHAAQCAFGKDSFALTELYQGIYDDKGQLVGYMKVYGDGSHKLV